MSEMIERAAEAIWEICAADDLDKPSCVNYARAVVQALRDSTLVYRDNGQVVREMRGAPDDIWKTLLDAVLQDETPMSALWMVVSGGRYYADYDHVKRVLDYERPAVVVQGECPTPTQGADGLAKRWCRENGVPCVGVEAMWNKHGKSAGPIRNGWMLLLFPIYKLIAFPGGKGTANAVAQAELHEILVRDERSQV